MYNIFKRPMFKMGGMTQGTGIMSHVESRPQYFSGGRAGYANGPGPVVNPFTYFAPSVIPKAGFKSNTEIESSPISGYQNRSQKLLEKIKSGEGYLGSSYIPFKENIDLDNLLIQEGLLSKNAPITERLAAREKYKMKEKQGIQTLPYTEEDINFATGLGGQKIVEQPKVNPPKYTETAKPKFNLIDEVKKESAELRELLKDEDYSRGELALIVSAALGKKGTISEKIQEATKLALPVARARKEEDKAVTLAAYKLAKEKEQQQIKSGALPESLKILRAQAEKQAAATGRDTEEVYSQLLTQNIKLDPVTAESVQTLSSTPVYGEITKLVNNIKDAQRRREDALESKKDTKPIDRELLDLNSQLDTYKKSKGFELVYPQFMNFASGGRVMKAVGGDVEEVEDNKLVASNVSFGSSNPQDATVVEKPVQKLSYAQLRDRLPKEITNDVVMLLSNSEEALQDFAYIRTQDDVGKFNIKYGVNLVVPPTAG
jgi:hypothetical protein